MYLGFCFILPSMLISAFQLLSITCIYLLWLVIYLDLFQLYCLFCFGNWIQGLAHAWQVLVHWATSQLSTYNFIYFPEFFLFIALFSPFWCSIKLKDFYLFSHFLWGIEIYRLHFYSFSGSFEFITHTLNYINIENYSLFSS
jgi:hypothetical protein